MATSFVHGFELPGVRLLTARADADLASRTPDWVINVTIEPDLETGNTKCNVYYPNQGCDLEAVELIISVWFAGLLTDEDFYDRYPEFKQAPDPVEVDRLLAEKKAEHAFLKSIEARCMELYRKRTNAISA